MAIFKEAKWNRDSILEWFGLWSELWALGDIKWEWQVDDLYSTSESIMVIGPWHVERVSDMNHIAAIPLPTWAVVQDMAEFIYDRDRNLYNRIYDFSQKIVAEIDESIY